MSLPPLHSYRHQSLTRRETDGTNKTSKQYTMIPVLLSGAMNLYSQKLNMSLQCSQENSIFVKGKMSMGLQSLCKGHIIGMLGAVDWLCEQTVCEMECLIPICTCFCFIGVVHNLERFT